MEGREIIGFEGSLIRDPKTQAIINVDTDAYNQFIARIEKEKSRDQQIRDLTKRIDDLEALVLSILQINTCKE